MLHKDFFNRPGESVWLEQDQCENRLQRSAQILSFADYHGKYPQQVPLAATIADDGLRSWKP